MYTTCVHLLHVQVLSVRAQALHCRRASTWGWESRARAASVAPSADKSATTAASGSQALVATPAVAQPTTPPALYGSHNSTLHVATTSRLPPALYDNRTSTLWHQHSTCSHHPKAPTSALWRSYRDPCQSHHRLVSIPPSRQTTVFDLSDDPLRFYAAALAHMLDPKPSLPQN